MSRPISSGSFGDRQRVSYAPLWVKGDAHMSSHTEVAAMGSSGDGRASARAAGWSAVPLAGGRSLRLWRPSRVAAVAFVIGLAVTAAFALTSLSLYDSNENRLLHLRAREVGSVLTAAVPAVQTPLASAAELADATAGDHNRFRAFMAPYVGVGRQFGSASLWRLGTPNPAPSAVVGAAPILASLPARARAFFTH